MLSHVIRLGKGTWKREASSTTNYINAVRQRGPSCSLAPSPSESPAPRPPVPLPLWPAFDCGRPSACRLGRRLEHGPFVLYLLEMFSLKLPSFISSLTFPGVFH